DSPVTWDAGKIHYQWETPKELIRSGTGVQKIDNSSQAGDSGVIYSVSRIYDNKKYVNSETYAIYSTTPFTKVTSSAKGNQIQLDISNMFTSDYTYSMYGSSDGLLDSVHTYMVDTKNSRLDFKLYTDKFTYDLTHSSEFNNILYLTIYYNYLDKVVIGSNDSMDYITLAGNFRLNPIINNFHTTITVDLPGIKKGFGDQFVNISDAINLYYTSVYYTSDGTHLILGLKNTADYYITEEGNSFTIMLPKDKNTVPVVPKEPAPDPVVPDYPVSGAEQYQLIIPNPSGLNISQIEHEDQYYNLRFSIKLPGDYVSYFLNYPVKVNSGVIKDVSVFLNSQNKTEILVTTSKIQGYKLYADQNYIYVKVANPKDIYKNIVVLDPGHGGSQPGANYYNTFEKTLNFKILYEIGKQFFDSDPDRLKVYYTRVSDVDVSLADRAAFAEKVGADLFVSLHMNASTSKSVYGTEVYYSTSNNKPNKAGLTSEILAKLFVNNITYALNTFNRGIRAEKYTVVHKNTVPAVLIELGFMSNQNEFNKLSNPDFQYLAAKTIYETLLQVFELYPTGR
ncbi:MAG TPA: N-acetylmuramoyl-L-alanine amidase, partial [Mobilitalea sp.]|nr:N-acetylmuramoyl-L-alanine amidase [Mobilitalea sp.]